MCVTTCRYRGLYHFLLILFQHSKLDIYIGLYRDLNQKAFFKQTSVLNKHLRFFFFFFCFKHWSRVICHSIKGYFFTLQTYGYEHILTLNNLEKAGLLKPQTGGRNNYPTIRKTLRLWMDDVNEQVNSGLSSTHLPLSIKLYAAGKPPFLFNVSDFFEAVLQHEVALTCCPLPLCVSPRTPMTSRTCTAATPR